MSRKNMMLVLSGSALGLTSVALAGTPDLDRAYAAELRADTASYTSLLQGGATGQDGAFHIGDGSGNNLLNIGGLIQFRYVYDNRSASDYNGAADAEDTGVGFETHRTQLNFTGNVISPNWQYAITLDFGQANDGAAAVPINGDTDSIIRDAWVQYNFEGDSNGTYLKFGQSRSPVIYEEAASDSSGLAAERSIVGEFFSGGNIQGVTLGHSDEQWKGGITLHDGMGWQGDYDSDSGSTNWTDEMYDYGVALRFDYKVEGDWAQFDQSSSFRGSNNGFRLGAGLDYQSGGSTDGDGFGDPTDDVTYTLWTIDGQYQGNGWNVGASIIGNSYDPSGGTKISNTGFVVQGGYFVSDDVELFGRYEYLDLDSDFVSDTTNTQSWLTVGMNYFLTPQSQAAKVTVDVVWQLDDSAILGDPGYFGYGSTGLVGGSDDELALRGQLQLVF